MQERKTMKKNMVVSIILCLISSSAWSMKRSASTETGNPPKKVQVEQPTPVPIAANNIALGQQLLALCKTGSSQPFKNLLAQGADLSVGNETGLAIHNACFNGDYAVVQLLLDKQDVNARNQKNATPLHWAAVNGPKDLCELLVTNKADVNARNQHNATPLHIAAQKGHEDLCKALITHKADVNARNQHNTTPLHFAALHFAAQKGHEDLCKTLIALNADVNARLNRDAVWHINIPVGEFTPLHLAVRANKLDAVKALIEQGADKYALTQDQKNVLDIARIHNYKDLVAYLEPQFTEELPATPLPIVEKDQVALPNLISAVEQANTLRVEQLLEDKAYTADEFRVAYKKATELNYYHMMGLMAAKGPVSFDGVLEKVSMS
jgi:ankyrin repeat protein